MPSGPGWVTHPARESPLTPKVRDIDRLCKPSTRMLSVSGVTLDYAIGRRQRTLPAAAETRTGVVMSAGPWLERTVLFGESRKRATYGPLRAYLPYDGSSNEPWIRAVVGKGVPLKPITHRHLKVWELSAGHLLPLAAAMADRYGEVEIRLQVSPKMKCSHSCQTARADTVWECVCECGGRHHSGKGTYNDWYSTGRFRIERQGDIEVRQIQIRRGQIPLPPEISPAALERALPKSPPQAPPVQRAPHHPTPPTPPSGISAPDRVQSAGAEPAQPTPRPRVVPEPPIPALPAASRSTAPRDLGRAPTYTPRPQSTPPLPVATPEPRKPGQVWPLMAAAAIVAALVVGLWLVLPTGSKDEPRGTSNPETVQQEVAEPAPPPPVVEEPAPPPVQAPPPAAPPHGCYPFQQNC